MSDDRTLRDLIEAAMMEPMPAFDELFLPVEDTSTPLCEALINGRYSRNIRIDSGSHLQGGDIHAHVFGRRGNELLAVKLDGSSSHGTKGKLHPDDADALRNSKHKFNIRPDNIVEWFMIGDADQLIFG